MGMPSWLGWEKCPREPGVPASREKMEAALWFHTPAWLCLDGGVGLGRDARPNCAQQGQASCSRPQSKGAVEGL